MPITRSRRGSLAVGICAMVTACSEKPAQSPGADTTGRLPPVLIQATIRKHYKVFRHCFEAGLARDPKLGGRVSIRFVITESGAVEGAADSGSDLPDAQVVACIAEEFGRIKFPHPEGGRVTVVYPVMLEPG
jgi:hypothetical protein